MRDFLRLLLKQLFVKNGNKVYFKFESELQQDLYGVGISKQARKYLLQRIFHIKASSVFIPFNPKKFDIGPLFNLEKKRSNMLKIVCNKYSHIVLSKLFNFTKILSLAPVKLVSGVRATQGLP